MGMMQKMLPKNLQGNFKIDWESVSKNLKIKSRRYFTPKAKNLFQKMINEFEIADEFKSRGLR